MFFAKLRMKKAKSVRFWGEIHPGKVFLRPREKWPKCVIRVEG